MSDVFKPLQVIRKDGQPSDLRIIIDSPAYVGQNRTIISGPIPVVRLSVIFSDELPFRIEYAERQRTRIRACEEAEE
jgi:hypothetical protein